MQINAQREAGKGGGETQNLDPRVDMHEEGGELVCRLAGNWTTRRVALVDKTMRAIPARNGFRSLVVDLSDVGRMDTAGAWLIERLVSTARANGIETSIEGHNDVSRILLDAWEMQRGSGMATGTRDARTSLSSSWRPSASASTRCATISWPR